MDKILIALLACAGCFLYVHLRKQKKKAAKYEKAVNELKLIRQAGKKISSKLEMEELLPAIIDAFVRAADVSRGSVMLYDRKKDLLEIKASVGLSDAAKKQVKLRPGEGIAGRSAETGQAILTNSTAGFQQYKDFFSDDIPPTLLSLPLVFEDKLLGVIVLEARSSGIRFTEEDKRLLSILASRAAVSIHNARMYETAITDDLTGLYMKRYFKMRLEEEVGKSLRYGRPLSLLFIDIDHLKEFNNAYGHRMGDRALVHLSKVIKNNTRAVDVPGRYGGEKFAIILPETPKKHALILARRLRKNIEKKYFLAKGRQLRISVSIGLGEYKPKMSSCPELIHEAEENLYRAKQQGRNQVVS